jgi:heme O synthase-like polyprenyltransferase
LILIGSIFKGIGGATIGYFGVFFFTQVYAKYDKEFSILNIFISIGGGIPSSLLGGYLGDYYESEKGGCKLNQSSTIGYFG